MKARLLAAVCILQLTAGLLPAAVFAQATGQINGLITDSSDSVLPGVVVEATNLATGLVRSATTGGDGLYTIPLLPPGDYDVKASLQGFRSAVQQKIRVTVSETANIPFKLEIGQVSETVSVVGTATLVETTNATHGIVIDNQKVVDLPLNGRNFAQLGTLIPGVVAPPTSLGGQTGDATPGGFGNATGGFNVNGARNQSNNFLMDGATNNDTFNTGFVLRPPPDAIEEFKNPHACVRRRVRAQRRIRREPGDQIGIEPPDRLHLGIQSRRCAAGAQLLRVADAAQAGAEAEPVRCRRRLPNHSEPVLRLRLLRRLSQQNRHALEHPGALGRAAGRRFLQP
ncbi:MAG: carboxypeptidase-like regulatory domain-containing protein, partial [Vicinamibacterales bacterium]